LALLYTLPIEGSPYRGNTNIHAWTVTGLRFWTKRQHADGSFDEYYPFEHGYIPTSFSLYAVVEACRVLDLQDGEVMEACVRAATYLSRTQEQQALNQESAAIPGLYATYLLTGEANIKEAVERKVANFCALQSSEGWFAEYGGADIGYLSTTLDYLAEYWRMSDDDRAWAACAKILDFSRYFIHQDGSAGGQYGSRNTEYFLLSGLATMAGKSSLAVSMLAKLREQITAPESAYASFDDRYLCHNMLHSLLRAIRNLPERQATPLSLPCQTDHSCYFPEAGILSYNRQGRHLICALKKGGVIRLFNDGREIFCDFGYRLKRQPGTTAATNWLNHDLEVQCDGDSYSVNGPLTEVPQQAITPWRHMALRLAAKVLGRRLIPSLKKRLIFVDRRSQARLAQKVLNGPDTLEIEDQIHVGPAAGHVYPACKFSLRHVASSKYYQADELAEIEGEGWSDIEKVVVRRRVDCTTGAVETEEETS